MSTNSNNNNSDGNGNSNGNRNYWKEEEENLLKQWADKAQCYQWMHSRSHNIYSRKNALFTIPVIIISTITGTANFAQERFSDEYKTYVVLSIGTLSIIAGIITTIYQFLKIAELNEGHRVSTLSWGKFYRNIKTELNRHPLDRMAPLEFIKISKDEYDRLVELSPFMPLSVINEFNRKFKKNAELCKPEICDELSSTVVYSIDHSERIRLMNEALNIKKPRLSATQLKRKTMIKKQVDEKTRRFRETFHSLNGRDPTQAEINKNIGKYINNDTQDDSLIDIAFDPMNSQMSQISQVNPMGDLIDGVSNTIERLHTIEIDGEGVDNTITVSETAVNEVLEDVAGRTEDTLNNRLDVNTIENSILDTSGTENNDGDTGNDDTNIVSIV